MAELQEFDVRLSNGLTGKVLRSSRFLDKREYNTVKLSNGTEITVPSATLEPQPDGTFFFGTSTFLLGRDRRTVRRALPKRSWRAMKPASMPRSSKKRSICNVFLSTAYSMHRLKFESRAVSQLFP